jgi:hypothetical protein
LLGAFTVYKLALDTFGVPGELHGYYPASTGFYLELAPGDKLTRRFIAYLDSQTAQPAAVEANPTPPTTQTQAPVQPTPPPQAVPPVAPSAAPSAVSSGAPSAVSPSPLALAMEQKRTRFRRIFLQKFNSTFNSYFSLGVWPNQTTTGQAVDFDNGNVLVIFPLRDNLSLPDVVRRFELDIQDFKQAAAQNIPYLEEKNSGTALAILNRKLLITNTPAAMQTTLAHYVHHEPNVFDEPHNRQYLAQLPWFRQGTCILNNSVYTQPEPPASASPQPASLSASPLNAFGRVLPVMVGAIQAMPDQRLAIRFIAPVMLGGIADGNLRADIQSLFQNTDRFPQASQLPPDTGLMVGVNGMDKVYDLYQGYLMPAENERWLSMMSLILNGFRIDLRKDIVGLLENRTVIASRVGQRQSLMVLLDKTPQKDRNLDKLSALLSSNAFPIKQELAQIGDLSVKTLSLPEPMAHGAQNRISYGTVGTSLVFATPDDFAETVKVVNREQTSLAAQPIYQSTMSGLPDRSNLLMYLTIRHDRPVLNAQGVRFQNAAQWLDAVGLSVWANPQSQDKAKADITVLNGQLNLTLARRKRSEDTASKK